MSFDSITDERDGCQPRYERMLHRWADKMRLTRYQMARVALGEFFGSIVLLYFGIGCLAQYRINQEAAFVSVSFGWGMSVMLGVFISGTMGYGSMNPAVSLAYAFVGKIPWIMIPLLTVCQVAGAFLGTLIAFFIYKENIYIIDNIAGGGTLLMNTTGSIFVTSPTVGNIPGLYDQIIGTAMLAALCSAIGDPYNFKVPRYLEPVFVGLLIYSMVGAFGVNAGAALNPSRDLAARLAILSVGYKDAFSDNDYYFWVPIVGPYIGAFIGASLYELFGGIHLRGVAEAEENEKTFEKE